MCITWRTRYTLPGTHCQSLGTLPSSFVVLSVPRPLRLPTRGASWDAGSNFDYVNAATGYSRGNTPASQAIAAGW